MTTETNQPPKPRGYRFWLIRLALLLGLPIMLYSGYCWGLWGRSSLLLQYLFQCGCPPASEEARYPLQVDIVVPACHYLSSTSSPSLSPSGRLLHVRTKRFWRFSSYLLDLQTMEKIDVTKQPFSSFLTDDLWFVDDFENYIIDRTTGRQYPIQNFRYWRENAYVNEEPNLELLVSALQQAEQVFFTQRGNDTVVVLMPNFFANPDQGFTFDRSDIREGNFNDRVEQFLQKNKIVYQTVPANVPFPNEVISPDRRFIAHPDGIYLIETGKKIVEGYFARGLFHLYSGKEFGVRGWTYDGTGVIYSKFLNPCLIEPPGLDGPGCWFEVPQPVLKLKVPEEYLLPAEIP